jgi:hypothetical protein
MDCSVKSISRNAMEALDSSPALVKLNNWFDNFTVVHVLQGLVKVLDGIHLADLVDGKPALPMKLNELGDELQIVSQ